MLKSRGEKGEGGMASREERKGTVVMLSLVDMLVVME